MPTKTDNILSNLPFSFRPAVRNSALRAVAAAAGGELHNGEVALARILRSHWLDTADKNAAAIDDLARIGSLWGLAPLRDNDGLPLESIEQFREHLRRYVRTLLEGTVTVKGILRLASDILGVTIDLEGEQFDPWWRREDSVQLSLVPRGDDAAALLFGVPAIDAAGVNAQRATIVGTVNLSVGIELGFTAKLRLQVDDEGPFDIDLSAGKQRTMLPDMVAAINAKFSAPVARHDGRRLIVESIRTGPEGRLEIEDQDEDAAPAVFGLPALIYTGVDSTGASVKSVADLSAGIDMRHRRFLRLVVDGVEIAEIDCAGTDPEFTLLDHIRDKINAAFGRQVASHDNQFLFLQSATTGAASSVFIQEPAAQDAAVVLGFPKSFFLGTDARPAEARGIAELTNGVDLSEGPLVRVRVDAAPPVTVNCAGADPSKTTAIEIANALNAALGQGTAFTDGERVALLSHTAGRPGQIVFEPAGDQDGLQKVFGFAPRIFHGLAALPASITGTRDIAGAVNLMASHLLGLAVDDGDLIEVNLRSHAADPSKATPQEIVDAINAVFPELAFTDGKHVLLTSQTVGGDSRVSVVPLESRRRRRFTTRAMILEEASQKVLGFTARRVTGDPATKARIVGTPDLSFGVDLREQRWLNISIDGAPPSPVDVAGPRPRATVISEIVPKLKAKLGDDQVADDGKHLLLISPSTGSGSSIVFHPVTVLDAAPEILGPSPYAERRGTDATRVVFVSTVDLSQGVDLAPDARLKIGLDGDPAVEIPLNSGTVVTRVRLGEIAAAINFALNASIASQDGRRLTLSSRKKGTESRLQFEVPSGTDATKLVLGIDAPRSYQGDNATRAEIQGTVDIDTVDLSTARFILVSVNGQPPKVVDCAVAAVDPAKATLQEIVQSLNQGINGLASKLGDRVVLHSNSTGSASRISLQPHVTGDARAKLFGDVPPETRGVDPQPARLTGEVSLLQPADLYRHRWIRLAIDGARPVEIDIAGDTPAQTSHFEIIDRMNAVLPRVASLTPDGKLLLTSPGEGESSSIEVFPRRFLELIEYPPEARSQDVGPVRHGQTFDLRNDGASDTDMLLRLEADKGVVDPAFVNHSRGIAIGIETVVRPGDRLVVDYDPDTGLIAHIESPLTPPHPVPQEKIIVKALDDRPVTGNPLAMPRGVSHWTFLECTGARFDEARFDQDHFAGFPCTTLGIFDVSRLDGTGGSGASIFWPPPPPPEPAARLSFHWEEYRNGAFELNLPAELAPVFGGRFNEARFGLGKKSEKFERVVFEPEDDPDFIVTLINANSKLVEASDKFTNVPIGFEGQRAPFRKPRFLTLGDAAAPSRIYLREEGFPGIIELKARENGDWGNQISVSLRPDGPARYQLEIFFEGERFEGARDLVLGGADPIAPPPPPSDLPACARKPLPFASLPAPGVLQGKAAGVRARVTRDRTGGD
jgi:hypothetical protein